MKSARPGRQQDLTSEVLLIPEVEVPDAQVLPDSIAGSAGALPCHAVRARKVGRRLVLLGGPGNVDRMLTLAGCPGDPVIGDVDQVELAVAALPQLSDQEPFL